MSQVVSAETVGVAIGGLNAFDLVPDLLRPTLSRPCFTSTYGHLTYEKNETTKEIKEVWTSCTLEERAELCKSCKPKTFRDGGKDKRCDCLCHVGKVLPFLYGDKKPKTPEGDGNDETTNQDAETEEEDEEVEEDAEEVPERLETGASSPYPGLDCPSYAEMAKDLEEKKV